MKKKFLVVLTCLLLVGMTNVSVAKADEGTITPPIQLSMTMVKAAYPSRTETITRYWPGVDSLTYVPPTYEYTSFDGEYYWSGTLYLVGPDYSYTAGVAYIYRGTVVGNPFSPIQSIDPLIVVEQ